jgi:hypothetical protein
VGDCDGFWDENDDDEEGSDCGGGEICGGYLASKPLRRTRAL